MFGQAFGNIDDILRKEAGCTADLDYTEQSSWRKLAALEAVKKSLLHPAFTGGL